MIKPFRLKGAVSFHPSISIINIVILLFCEDLKSYTKGKSFRLLEQKLYVFIYCLFVCVLLVPYTSQLYLPVSGLENRHRNAKGAPS